MLLHWSVIVLIVISLLGVNIGNWHGLGLLYAFVIALFISLLFGFVMENTVMTLIWAVPGIFKAFKKKNR